ncbi:TonB-dependent siderophore receptor [Bacterioplanoides sp.]|uniref:TonB-dependent siderophore receptor n=1 Tax=Bacterioplanoides sp. TaxID=2066072 RepID=UPI003B5AD12F
MAQKFTTAASRSPSAVKSKLALAVAKSMLLTALGGVVISPNVLADTVSEKAVANNTLEFNIAAGSLENALNQLGQQAGILLSYSPQLTSDKTSTALTGKFTLAGAFKKLLDGTGLMAVQQADGSYTLQPLKQVEYQLDDVKVRGTLLSRYEFDRANSATGFETDVDGLPRSVQVLPEQLILDQNSERLTDVLINAVSVSRSDGFGGAQDEVFIRGMDNSHIFIDGSPVSPESRIDVELIDRVEVISGPASVLHGQVSPGGLINIVRKQPEPQSAQTLQVMVDNQGRQKLMADSTGGISDEVQYRFIVAHEDSDSFREVKTQDGTTKASTENLTIAPSISYTPDSFNTLTFSLDYSDKTVPIDRGTVAIDDGAGKIKIADIPVERRLGSEYSTRESIEKRASLGFDHEFRNGWINRLKLSYSDKEYDDYQARPAFGLNGVPSNLLEVIGLRNTSSIQANGLLARSADTNIDVSESDIYLANSLSGDFRVAGIDNRLFVGVNYTQRELDKSNGFALQDISRALGAPIPIYAPVLDILNIYDPVRPSYTKRPQQVLNDELETHTEYGISVQNLTYLTDEMTLLLGLRYDKFELDSEADIYFSAGPQAGTYVELAKTEKRKIKSSNDNISGQIGVLHQLTGNISLYASYAESFIPNYPDVTTSGLAKENLDPEEAAQYELGFKSSFMDDKLRIVGSVYQLERENVLTVDNNFQSRLNGKEKSEGIELTATMQFIPGLNVLASMTHLNAEIVEDDQSDNEGNTPKSVPQNKARAWGSYEFQSGNYAGLGIGLGAEYVDEREGDDENRFTLPSYTLWDAAAWYYVSVSDNTRIRLQAGIKNLTDKEYYPASINAFRVNVGEPRTSYISARLEF